MVRRNHKQVADPAVAAAVFAIISAAERPIARDVIIDRVHVRIGLPRRWSLATSSRRVREAFGLLIDNGAAVVSDGKGYRIAKSQADLDVAAARLRRGALSLLRRASLIQRVPLSHVMHQMTLEWDEVVDPEGRRASHV